MRGMEWRHRVLGLWTMGSSEEHLGYSSLRLGREGVYYFYQTFWVEYSLNRSVQPISFLGSYVQHHHA